LKARASSLREMAMLFPPILIDRMKRTCRNAQSSDQIKIQNNAALLLHKASPFLEYFSLQSLIFTQFNLMYFDEYLYIRQTQSQK
ncbi:hypothetical protein LJD42_29460, partial [Escherichia coli]|nr:hypothetical protein [Escherichia coli]